MPDEGSYYILGHRLSFGDRMISDEWNLTQFGSMPVLPIYYIYTWLHHSTDGIVLFMRYAFLAADLLMYVYMYIKLRSFKAAGVAASVLFCAMFPQTFLAFSYCTGSLMAFAVICLILFFGKKTKTALQLFFTGVLFALSVQENPFLVFIFLLWLVFVAVFGINRRRERPVLSEFSFLLEPRAFLWITAGTVTVFLVFIGTLLYNDAFAEFRAVLPFLFSGGEYNAGNLIEFSVFKGAAGYFGTFCTVGLVCCLSAAGIICVRKINNPRVVILVFTLSALFYAGSCAGAFMKMLPAENSDPFSKFSQFHHFPMLLFSPIPFLLDPHRDRKRTAFLVIGLLYSVFMDIPSKSFLAIGGFLVRIPLILQLQDLVVSFVSEIKGKKKSVPGRKARRKNPIRPFIYGVLAVCLAVCSAWDIAYIGAEGVYKVPERLFLHTSQPMDHTITKGPFKGLTTTEFLGQVYEDTLSDLDQIREEPDCAVAVLDFIPYAYMYLDRPYATFSPVYMGEIERLSDYWNLPYTRTPDYIYIPYYNNLAFLRYNEPVLNVQIEDVLKYVDADCTQGKAGYILHVREVYGSGAATTGN